MFGFGPISSQPISSLESAAAGAYTLACDAAAYVVAAQDASLIRGRVVDAEAGAYALAGQDASLLRGRVVTADAAAYALDGQDATLTYTPAVAYTLTADPAAFTWTGQDADLVYSAEAAGIVRRHAGGYKLRKGYIIKGKRYWLTDDELMVLVAQEIASISRKDVKQVTAGKPKPISKRVWDLIAPMERLEALTPAEDYDESDDESDDEDALMMMF